ncbi:hypothetical protein ACFR97_01890 [Haloplanus litoreus]|uniref:Uncharacterized protein n=1 Tax=Haloplanus litoreus TaxID=767515 RepID=A0ABD5ZVB4_9EURY
MRHSVVFADHAFDDLGDVTLTPRGAYDAAESVVELRQKAARNVRQTVVGGGRTTS